jgi:hypothetical protein
MYTVTYYKFGERWYLDLPEYIDQGGDPDDLERVGAFHDFLEQAAAGETTVAFLMDTQPFDGADQAIFTGSSGGKTGGYYHIIRFEGKPVDFELWFNLVLYLNQPELPGHVYFKKVHVPNRT